MGFAFIFHVTKSWVQFLSMFVFINSLIWAVFVMPVVGVLGHLKQFIDVAKGVEWLSSKASDWFSEQDNVY